MGFVGCLCFRIYGGFNSGRVGLCVFTFTLDTLIALCLTTLL